jgi:DNA-binding PadR family transcriptional regulator
MAAPPVAQWIRATDFGSVGRGFESLRAGQILARAGLTLVLDTISIVDIVPLMTSSDRAPLPQSAIHVLIAIGPREMHGYAIMSEIDRITDGAVRVGPGTLYTSIKRLLASGLLEETSERPDPALDDQRRRYYRLTAAGRQVAAAEVERLRALVAAAAGWANEIER